MMPQLPSFFRKLLPPSCRYMTVKLTTVVFSGITMVLTLSDPMSDLVRHYDFPVSDTFPDVVRTLANR
jgi:hypothetical protein